MITIRKKGKYQISRKRYRDNACYCATQISPPATSVTCTKKAKINQSIGLDRIYADFFRFHAFLIGFSIKSSY